MRRGPALIASWTLWGRDPGRHSFHSLAAHTPQPLNAARVAQGQNPQ